MPIHLVLLRAERRIEWQRPLGQPLRQRLSRQVLHDQEVDPVLVPHVVKRADMGVVQCGEGLGFALEAGNPVGISGERRGQHLDRDIPVELRIPRIGGDPQDDGSDRRGLR